MTADFDFLQAALQGYRLQRESVSRKIAEVRQKLRAAGAPKRRKCRARATPSWRNRWGTLAKRWSPAEIERLRELYAIHRPAKVAEMLGRGVKSVQSKAKVLHLGKRKYWQPAEIERLRQLYPNTSNSEIGKLLGRTRSAIDGASREFGLSKSPEYLKAHARLQKGSEIGILYRFAKGTVPANKGIRRPGYARGRMAETQFKKGQRPLDWKPVGTITTDGDGYKHIKVREPRPDERNPGGCGRGYAWEFLHQHLWEKHHGPIAAKHAVVFKDGNREHCVIENLECIPKADLVRRNAMWNRLPPELIEVITLNAAIKRKLRKLGHGEK